MGVFVAILWAVQIVDSVTHYPLLRLGIDPRSVGKIEDIFTAPFIHASYNHLLGNTVPLLVLGLFVALRGIRRFLLITGVIVLISGLGVWLTAASGSDTVGASGVIFGYFGFLVARGFIERRITDVLVGVVVGILYWSILPGLLPDNPGVSWQGHLFGLIGGITAAWLFRRRHDEPHATVSAAT
jgi:membrane associated rhomboid family serine protease